MNFPYPGDARHVAQIHTGWIVMSLRHETCELSYPAEYTK